MKFFSLAALSFLASQVSGHYIWVQLDIGGTAGAKSDGIRPNTNYNSPVIGMALR